MADVLVTYATKTGCTADVAERISEVLSSAGLSVESTPAEADPDPSDAGAVVVGSGVRRMRWYKPVVDWVGSNAEHLKEVPVAFFSVGLTPVRFPELETRIAAYTFSLLVRSGIQPIAAANFKGCFDPSALSRRETLMVRAMGVAEGDYREWEVIEAWARGMVDKLAARQPTG